MLFWIKNTIFIKYIGQYNFIDSILFYGIASLLLSFFMVLVIGRYVIIQLRDRCFFQIIRLNGPKSHLLKQNIPTMGGIIILLSVTTSIMICADLSNICVWYVLFILFAYGILGLIDDLYKIKKKNTDGLSVSYKYFWQSCIALILIALIFIYQLYQDTNVGDRECFCKNIIFQLDFWDILLAYFVIVGTSNSVNLSDGLDGLAIVPIILITAGLAVIAWISSDLYYSKYLHVSYISHAKALIIVCAVIIGSGLGFLWFNAYPAQIFMGDTGSLAFGGAIGLIAILLHQEFLLLIMGGVFVIETLSVILQVGFFKFFKKRIFKMAPIHHHFEIQGYLEPKIVVRFWITSFILVCLSLLIFMIK